MSKKPKKGQVDWSNLEALSAQLLAYDYAIACLFEVLSKTNPETAEQIAQKIEECIRRTPPEWAHVGRHAAKYVEVIRSSRPRAH